MAERKFTFVGASKNDIEEIIINEKSHTVEPATLGERVSYTVSYPGASLSDHSITDEKLAQLIKDKLIVNNKLVI